MKTQKNRKIRRRTLRGGSKEKGFAIYILSILIRIGAISDETANFILGKLKYNLDYQFVNGIAEKLTSFRGFL